MDCNSDVVVVVVDVVVVVVLRLVDVVRRVGQFDQFEVGLVFDEPIRLLSNSSCLLLSVRVST